MANYNKFRDISLSFKPHPITGDLSVVTDEKSINQSLKNLIFMDFYSVPFESKVGSNVRARLFDLITSATTDIIKNDIRDVIENYEPRIEIIDIFATKSIDRNGINVKLIYTARTSTIEIVVNFFLERII